MSPRRILVLSGPNLDLVGTGREPAHYGTETLEQIHARLARVAVELRVAVDCEQTPSEGELVSKIGAARESHAGLVLNAGAYTHTSLAIHDAIIASGLPCVEVHLSNPEARERFRHRSVLARACIGKVSGFKGDSYELGLIALVRHLGRNDALIA